MKKILFNDKYRLTDAVINGMKKMTRRIVPEHQIEDYYGWLADMSNIVFDGPVEFQSFEDAMISKARYKVGEVVAVSLAYKDIEEYNPEDYEDVALDCGVITSSSHPYSDLKKTAGWSNKMFVMADLMPIKIRITDVKVERLQDISDEDCLKEGIFGIPTIYTYYGAISKKSGRQLHWTTPREAFASLIDKVSGKGTWKSNPWTYAYSFKLVK